jgi:hypothetical protein
MGPLLTRTIKSVLSLHLARDVENCDRSDDREDVTRQ